MLLEGIDWRAPQRTWRPLTVGNLRENLASPLLTHATTRCWQRDQWVDAPGVHLCDRWQTDTKPVPLPQVCETEELTNAGGDLMLEPQACFFIKVVRKLRFYAEVDKLAFGLLWRFFGFGDEFNAALSDHVHQSIFSKVFHKLQLALQ